MLWYTISGTTFRAVFYVTEGFTSHLAAQALAQNELRSEAVAMQNNSIRAYQICDDNLPCEAIKALVCDETRVLTNLHFKWKNRTEALASAQRMETLMRQQLKTENTNSDRWKSSLAENLLFQARIFNDDSRKKEAIRKYRETITINQTLINENHTNTDTKSQLSSAQKELEALLK
ncbi:hypothetical protein BH11CYA1_BH11CYA1_10720 [soil metagenome]